MAWIDVINDNTLLIGVLLVGGFLLYKYVMQPIMNENEPIEPAKDHKFLEEQLEEAVQTSTDF